MIPNAFIDRGGPVGPEDIPIIQALAKIKPES
jgi:hypothetical protein